LEYLGCTVTSFITDWILHSPRSIDISNVHTLDVFIPRVDGTTNVSRILRRLGLSLEHLIIRISTEGMSYFLHAVSSLSNVCIAASHESIDMSCNPNIKTVSVVSPHQMVALPCLRSLLSCLVASNIERISFECYCDPEPEPTGIWEEIDSILCGEQFTSLREVKFEISRYRGYSSRDMFDTWCRMLSTSLPSLHARGLFHFSV
jgi:hypothetical protein